MPAAGHPGPAPLLRAVPDLPGAVGAPPVLVAAWVPDVVRAGLGVMLQPYGARVELLGVEDHARAHIELFDPLAVRVGPTTGLPRVALTWDTSARATERARELGAVRVLSLSLGVQELLAACEQAQRSLASDVVTRLEEDGDEILSAREVDVIRGICRGLSNADIAAELFVSINSVKTYIRTAYRKMGVSSRSQALLWGLERRL